MLIKFLRRHLSYAPNSVHDVEDEAARLYIANGLAVPAESETATPAKPEPVAPVKKAVTYPDPIVAVLAKNKGGRPSNKRKE